MCRQLYVLRASHALVQATVGVGTVIIVYIGVAYTRGVGYKNVDKILIFSSFSLILPRKVRAVWALCRLSTLGAYPPPPFVIATPLSKPQ